MLVEGAAAKRLDAPRSPQTALGTFAGPLLDPPEAAGPKSTVLSVRYDALAIPSQLANLAVTPAGSLPCDAGQEGACQGRACMTGVKLYCSNAYETCRPPAPDKSATHLGMSWSPYTVRGISFGC